MKKMILEKRKVIFVTFGILVGGLFLATSPTKAASLVENDVLQEIAAKNEVPLFLQGVEMKYDEKLKQEIRADKIPQTRTTKYTVNARGTYYNLTQVRCNVLCPTEFNWYDNGIPVVVIMGGEKVGSTFQFVRYDDFYFGMTGKYGPNYGYTWYQFYFKQEVTGTTYYTWVANKSSVNALVG